MTLVRTTFWNGIAVSVRLGSNLVLNKVLAVLIGPGGFALIGQFQNLVAILTTFATGAIGTGVTKFTAEYGDDAARRHELWRSAGMITFGASVTAAVLIVIFRGELGRHFLGSEALSGVFCWLAAALVLISTNALLMSILNGLKKIREYLISNIGGSLISLVAVVALAKAYGLYGALVALSINQGLVLFVTLWQVWFDPELNVRNLFGRVSPRVAAQLGSYVLMAATTALATPMSQIIVRGDLIAQFGLVQAGYWDGIYKLSTIYLTFVTTSLSLYYLPRLAEIGSQAELKREIRSTSILIVPAVMFLSSLVYLCRDLIIQVVFAPTFVPMRDLFAWQMAGDVIKISAWLLAYVMIGRSMTRIYIVTEVAFAAIFVASAHALTRMFGLTGVTIAHAFTYSLYLATMYWLIIVRPWKGREQHA